MICENFLFDWWAQLDTIMANKGLPDRRVAAKIHKLVPRSVTHGPFGLKKGFWGFALTTVLFIMTALIRNHRANAANARAL